MSAFVLSRQRSTKSSPLSLAWSTHFSHACSSRRRGNPSSSRHDAIRDIFRMLGEALEPISAERCSLGQHMARVNVLHSVETPELRTTKTVLQGPPFINLQKAHFSSSSSSSPSPDCPAGDGGASSSAFEPSPVGEEYAQFFFLGCCLREVGQQAGMSRHG